MHSFENALSLHFRRDNWNQIQAACRKSGFQLPKELIEGTIAQQYGAATALLELLYEHLTQKQIRRPEEIPAEDLEALQLKKKSQQNLDVDDTSAAPGAMGSTAIGRVSKAPEQLQFGEVKKRQAGDAVALRRQLGAA